MSTGDELLGPYPEAGCDEMLSRFGPHRAYHQALPPEEAMGPERLVDTHCCFCGQQCGIRLRVRAERVVGLEPRYDFPFNRGKLCPKGIKRYLQNGHPDRLLCAYERDRASPSGFRELPYQRAVAAVAEQIERIQREHGPDAFAVLSGASLTTEKTYLVGKFARACV